MRPSITRDKLLAAGLHMFLFHGYRRSSIRDIVEKANVAQGNFSSHFPSKEAFGLDVLEIYHADHYQALRATLRNDSLEPRARLEQYFKHQLTSINTPKGIPGCLLGNLCAEGHGDSELIRTRLDEMFGNIQRAIAYCLHAAQTAGDLSGQCQIDELAHFFLSSLQGAMLMCRARKSTAPLDRCHKQLLALLFEPLTPWPAAPTLLYEHA